MANFYATTRTNYFRVKDKQAFFNLMKGVETDGDKIDVWEEEDGTVGFGLVGCIMGFGTGDGSFEFEYDAFANALRDLVEEGDAIIILEVGAEKLRYVSGTATIITSYGTKYVNLTDEAVEAARLMLGNDGWTTKCDY